METETKKIEAEPIPPLAQPPDDVALEKAAAVAVGDEPKALVVVDKKPDPIVKKPSGGSIDRENFCFSGALAFGDEFDNLMKSQKNLSNVTAWENSKKASLEAKLKKIEEQLEKKKAEYAEKMKNKVALIHKQAEEKRAAVEAIKGEELLKAGEAAAKYRATGTTPKKLLGCF
ncbi:hypothetical protein FEM48_Zijuj07G0163100 [Ziziphus jujuba var. spinosa]|uniref:Remorin-like n=1 Tax=Ziziphus jujuba var. spinosa TaxID=714518 RepID=A0A978V5N5_ZIZJJ|nr:hypothetical protein FEM48_Zijuj07G0163100 [Ziziphus jujuba var. spinosa]